ncbi:MAG: hypothetical protein Fur0040_08100 [Sideroxydans sp.]
MEGVVRAPSAFSITLGLPPSMIATQELVVPRSIPMIFAMICSFQLNGLNLKAVVTLRPEIESLSRNFKCYALPLLTMTSAGRSTRSCSV